MIASNQKINLNDFFPFSECDSNLLSKALKLGKCVKYLPGETILLSGSPAKHCGVIIEGEAVAFKKDSKGKRYQLCLNSGYYIGLEVLHENQSYNSKIVAVTEIDIFFWNSDGLSQLCDDSSDFADYLHLLDEGRIYQEQYLIPESDVTDPVLISKSTHWLSLFSPILIILAILFISLWVCALLIRQYPVTWLLVIILFFAAGNRLYYYLSLHSNERFITTTKNIIMIPRKNTDDIQITKLYRLQSIRVTQNLIERLADAGTIQFIGEDQTITTPLLNQPNKTASLIHHFSQKDALGREIHLFLGKDQKRQVLSPQSNILFSEKNEIKSEKREFHAHWALMIKMVLRPFVLTILSFAAMFYFTYSPYKETIQKISMITAFIGIIGMIYQFISWRNHRFTIEENCVKDYSRSPLAKENQNMAMNHKIQSVRYQKDGFFQILFNYGTVYVLAGEGELSFDYVSNPKQVQQQIIQACSEYENKHHKEEQSEQLSYFNQYVSKIYPENDFRQQNTDY